MKSKCIVICGPTASGKSSLAIEMSRLFNGIIISADSMQIYKTLDIGTAKPTKEEQARAEHKLIDFLEPDEPFSVANYQKLCLEEIEKAQDRGKLPFLVGGTGLYIDSVVNNLQYVPIPNDDKLRADIEKRYDTEGGEKLLEELYEIDPETASRLFPRDRKRIVRALEVFKLTGRSLSYHNSLSRSVPSPTEFLKIVLSFKNRELLYERINKRVEIMFLQGLLEEAQELYLNGYKDSPTASQAIAYKELFGYFSGAHSLQEAKELLKQRSRNYAKRQITWFKRMDAHFIYMDGTDPINEVKELIEGFINE